ncbi:hypothetical protein Pr1d_42940 [Bythopirellula goksoeyrii]|uniref:Lipoprotein n=1 Tax=Bythopirellula goksoeyrii TaxID=1400387 RepID=A0A5B9QDI0_9BACT|nr:hypothetical protein Pr1d_42940 [Bythopirellula goksoeyrii]
MKFLRVLLLAVFILAHLSTTGCTPKRVAKDALCNAQSFVLLLQYHPLQKFRHQPYG